MKHQQIFTAALSCLLCALLALPVPLPLTSGGLIQASQASAATPVKPLLPEADAADTTRVNDAYGRLPIFFEGNHGQTDSRVKFLARGKGYNFFLTPTEVVLQLRNGKVKAIASESGNPQSTIRDPQSASLRMKLAGANPAAQIEGLDILPGRSSYFIGDDQSKWRGGIPHYARVRARGVYPGVDMVYYDKGGQLEYDFVIAPGADPGVIRLAFDGARRMRIAAQGDLVLGIPGGELRQHKPVAYQEVAGVKQEIACRYVQTGKRKVGFEVAGYDLNKPLVIDPVLVYSTYLGGSNTDEGYAIGVDSSGNAYVTGYTSSSNFPTANPTQPSNRGDGDVFVAKLDPTGSTLLYATYLGGSGGEAGRSIAVDSGGNAYVTGATYSKDFPTASPFYQFNSGLNDAFVVKLDPTGTALVYSTYFGGSEEDFGHGIAVDSAGNAYVTGETYSFHFEQLDFPTTPGAFQFSDGGGGDAFVARFSPTGSRLYCTYLGGSGFDAGKSIAVDAAGSAYVTGSTMSADFPPGSYSFQSHQAGVNAFVAKLDAMLATLFYSTYVGGSDRDEGSDIAVDAAGYVYLTGTTFSTDFPVFSGIPLASGGGGNAFVVGLGASNGYRVFSTLLGGSGLDEGHGIAVDANRNVYVTGMTRSPDFPVTPDARQGALRGTADAFVTRLHQSLPSGITNLSYSTYLGGNLFDSVWGIALNSPGDIYVTGYTSSTDFSTPGSVQTAPGGGYDAFAVRIQQVTPNGNLFAISRRGASGTTEVHALNGADNYRSFLLQTPTAQPQTGVGNESKFLVGDYNRDGWLDLYLIGRLGASNTTEVHVLNGRDNFQTWLLHTPTALHQTGTGNEWEFDLGDYNRDGALDLYVVSRMGSSGMTEVHVLNGANNFGSWLLQTTTALPQTGAGNENVFRIGDYNRDGHPDLFLVSRVGASGTTEVHALNGADNFRTWLLHTPTALHQTGTGNEWDFLIEDYNRDGQLDLYAIARAGGSGMTEVHVLNGAANFSHFLLQVATALHQTGTSGAWRFDM